MRRFGIPQRLYGIIALGGLGLVAAAVMVVWQLRDVHHDLETLHAEMRQHEQARVMQINLKKQVQEWDNILLRGYNPVDLEQYCAAFYQRSEAVRTSGQELQRGLRDPEAQQLLARFLDAHSVMSRTYDTALAQFIAGHGLDPRAADSMVRGQDRAPTDLIDQIVARINVLAHVEIRATDLRWETWEMVAAMAGLIILLCMASAVVSRSITRPLAETVRGLDRVAAGDLRYRIPIAGHDEVAQMNLALNATVEAIQRTHAQLTDAVADIEAARERLAMLHDIDLAIIAETAPAAIAEAVLWRLRDLLGVPRAIVNLFDWTSNEVEWLAAVGRHRMHRGPGFRYPMSLAGNLEGLRRGEPQTVNVKALTPSPEADALLASGVHVYMVVPMIAGGELIGSISFGGETADVPDEHVRIAQEVAAQLAIALRQARLIEKVQTSYEDLKRTQEQLTQAQKMEAIGQLAGGVAHDFNNLLTVIGGRSSLLLQKLGPDDPGRKHVELIERTSQRAAGLTRQLLAFSRKQVLQPKTIDLNALAAGVMPMLRRLIGEHIEIVMVPGPDLGYVMADPGQVEQVIMNLVVNARDAMPDGGMVKIETANWEVPEARRHAQGQVPPGRYIIVSVQDAGIGMDAPTLARIFEPFFTTKEPGKGTGLGLSTVHGIVHQSGGYIGVDSVVGRGTTFTIYLPRITEPVTVTVAPTGTPEELMRGTETVLLVEDEENVRQLSSEILKTCGYTVLETGDPLEALMIGEQRNGAIDLLLTDMVMPGMGGSELAERLAATNPKLRVLRMSGYADEMVAAASSEPGRLFLPKPFTPHDLAKTVRQALAGR
jgi:signal transduction histidine kinase/HAMP domain-containing protein